MKNLISFVTLLIFLHTTTYYMIATEAQEELPDPVLDTDGDDLLAAGLNTYFILPVISGPGGGGLVAAPAKGICQFAVAQHKSITATGQALSFFPDGYKNGDVVRESTDMNIGFSLSIGCWPSAIWKVDAYDKSAERNFVMLGGVVGNPGNETVSNWFKIERAGPFGYKIVFCPSVCKLCTVACSDVGIYNDNGQRRLALSDDDAFLVLFQKANSTTKSTEDGGGVWLN